MKTIAATCIGHLIAWTLTSTVGTMLLRKTKLYDQAVNEVATRVVVQLHKEAS